MENPRSEKQIIIKDMRNLFSIKRELNDTAIKDITNLFKLRKETKEIKYLILKY